MDYQEILHKLKSLSNPKNVKGMTQYGINPQNNLGISIYVLRPFAKEIGTNHSLALQLWDSEIHDARLLAVFIEDPKQVTGEQMDRWAQTFDSWDVCDQCCANLFDRTDIAFEKAAEWSSRDEEFIKRAGFSLIAALAWHDKKSPDAEFLKFLPLIKKGTTDERNFVKKSVNWALRQIGKKNVNLNKLAVKTAQEIQKIDSKAARWIAADALRELTGDAVQNRLK
jgi:3-methyladenine DNA glycosylase AlkD